MSEVTQLVTFGVRIQTQMSVSCARPERFGREKTGMQKAELEASLNAVLKELGLIRSCKP